MANPANKTYSVWPDVIDEVGRVGAFELVKKTQDPKNYGKYIYKWRYLAATPVVKNMPSYPTSHGPNAYADWQELHGVYYHKEIALQKFLKRMPYVMKGVAEVTFKADYAAWKKQRQGYIAMEKRLAAAELGITVAELAALKKQRKQSEKDVQRTKDLMVVGRWLNQCQEELTSFRKEFDKAHAFSENSINNFRKAIAGIYTREGRAMERLIKD